MILTINTRNNRWLATNSLTEDQKYLAIENPVGHLETCEFHIIFKAGTAIIPFHEMRWMLEDNVDRINLIKWTI